MHGFNDAFDVHDLTHLERIRQREGPWFQIFINGCAHLVEIFSSLRDPARRHIGLDLNERNSGVGRARGVAEFFELVCIAAMIEPVVDQDHAARSVHFGIHRFAEKLRMLGVGFAREDALFIEFLGLVAENHNQLVFDIKAGVVIVVVFRRRDAIPCEHHAT